MEFKKFDGVICFGGGDINYHNKGHFDMRIMEELSSSNKIMWVNSIGMRVPSISGGNNFFKKIFRKLKSIMRGVQKKHDNFYSISPVYIPGPVGHFLTKYILYVQVKILARYIGMKNPLVWVVTPTSADVACMISKKIVYQRTDKNEEMADADKEFILRCISLLKEKAFLTLFCSPTLYEEEREQYKRSSYIEHGVSDVFLKSNNFQACKFNGVEAKKVVFVGAIDEHTFDLDLLFFVARENSSCMFYLIGDVTFDVTMFEMLPNIKILGKVDQQEVPRYLASADVLAMYWNDSDWIKYCSPIKYKEYMLSGKAIVTTPFSNVIRSDFENGLFVAEDPDEFSKMIAGAGPEVYQRHFDVNTEGWGKRAKDVVDEINSYS